MFLKVFLLILPLLSIGNARAGIEPPVLRTSLSDEPITLDWHRAEADRYLISFMMRGLLKYDANAQLVCDLCRTYAVSPDGRTFTFELAAEEWSDGVRVEAQHFVDSFRRLLDPQNRFAVSADLEAVAGAKQGAKWDARKLGVNAEGAGKLRIELTKRLAVFPHLLTTVQTFPIRKDLMKKPGAKGAGEDHLMTAVLGPYQLAAWEHGKRLVIEGNPKYAAARPVYRVDFVFGTHRELVDKFKSGKLDILAEPTGDDMQSGTGGTMQVSPYWATRLLIPNLRHAPLRSLHARKALLLALARETLPAFVKSGERNVTGLIAPGLPGYRDLPLVTKDLAQAASEKRVAGEPFASASKLELLVRAGEADERVAAWLKGELAKLSLTLTVKSVPPARFVRELRSGEFDLALTVWAFDTATPLELLRSLQTDAPNNAGHWTNVAYDALLEKGIAEPSVADLASQVDQLTQIVETQDVGVIPLSYPTQPFLLGKRVISFAVTPFGDPDLVKIQLKQ